MTPAKVNAIRGEFMRQCDKLDGLVDGIINNYMACRAIFDVTAGRQEPPSLGGETLSRTTWTPTRRIPAPMRA